MDYPDLDVCECGDHRKNHEFVPAAGVYGKCAICTISHPSPSVCLQFRLFERASVSYEQVRL